MSVRKGSGRDVLIVWLYAAAVVALAAWATPLLYNAGKAMGEVTEGKQTNGFLSWLGARCREADFNWFFLIALGASAILLFLPFVEGLGLGRRSRGGNGQPLRKNPRGVLEWVTGLMLAGGLLLLTGYGLMMVGSFLWMGVLPGADWTWLWKTLPWIFAGVLLQEWLLRGVALGIFLRAMRPMTAIFLAGLLAALIHFVTPPAGITVPDPDADGTGFQLVGIIGARLAEPRVLLIEFLPLLAMGGVLGYARWRTASLWLPIGMHLGWQVAVLVFSKMAKAVPQTDPIAVLLTGRDLTEGLIPLAGVLAAGALVFFLTGAEEAEDEELV